MISDTWQHIAETYDNTVIEFVGTLIVQIVAFWIPCTIYLSLESIAPKFSERHKIQPPQRQPTKEEVRQCVWYVFKNQVWATFAHAGLLAISKKLGLAPKYDFSPSLPPLWQFLKHIIICALLREAGFYYSHRLFHHRLFYARIHKFHHKFVAPMAFASQYAHPIEHIVANILPIVLPPQLLHAHILTAWVFLASQLIETATVHSGYDFFHSVAKKHDLHHEKFMMNFGAIGVLDWIHGTDRLPEKKK
ncbi:hypothetical protein TRVA0_029S00650 [Trichomonascus vanleenenianus]|uniref:sterol desaturase family protein n=1 Tax=Trichomonascus vanleenenianus TaxID=2268995 RepID=UPI003ECA14CA